MSLGKCFKGFLGTLTSPFLFSLLLSHFERSKQHILPLSPCHHLLSNHTAKGNNAEKLQTETSESVSKINFFRPKALFPVLVAVAGKYHTYLRQPDVQVPWEWLRVQVQIRHPTKIIINPTLKKIALQILISLGSVL